MQFSRLVVPVVVAVLFVGGALATYQVADAAQNEAARTSVTVDNETLTQQVDQWQRVNESDDEFTAGFNDTVTVWNASGHELERATDFQWNDTDGAIRFENTDSTSDGADANISYTYFENTQPVQDLAGPLGTVTSAVGRLGYFGAAIGLVAFLLAVGGLFAHLFTRDVAAGGR